MSAYPAVTAPAFWDRVARKYAAKPISDPATYAHTMARTRAFLSADDQVLEVGCGTASTAILLAADVAQITASDISAEMVQIGREKLWENSVRNVTLVQGQLGDAALGPGPYDAVLAFNLLHLTADPAAEAAHAHALLKPGGHFISKSACLSDGGFHLRPLIAVMRVFGRAPFVNVFSRKGLCDQIARAGFRILEAEDHASGPPMHFIVAQKI